VKLLSARVEAPDGLGVGRRTCRSFANGADEVPTGFQSLTGGGRSEQAQLKGLGDEDPAGLAGGEASDALIAAILEADESADAQGGRGRGCRENPRA
jgi:hypothetical protein